MENMQNQVIVVLPSIMKPFYCIFLMLHYLAGLSQPPKTNTVFTHLDSACKYKDSVRYLYLGRERIDTSKLRFLKEMPLLSSLELEGRYLSEIPPQIFSIRQLQKLSIRWIKLTEIPQGIAGLENLRELTITGANIEDIPDWIGSLDSLKWINLEKNKISQLPVSLSQLRVLEKLYVNYNNIDSIPSEIFEIPALIELSLNNNPIRHIPRTILQARSLHRLNIESTMIPQNEYKQYRRELAYKPVIITADDKKSRYEKWLNRQGSCYTEDEIFDYEVFIKTEIAAAFKGTFSSFFNRELQLAPFGRSDTVVLRFIVKPGGGINKITALKFNSEITKDEAINITKSSCFYWKAGISGGVELLSWCTLQFIFKRNDDQQELAKTILVVTKLPQGRYPSTLAKPQ